MSVVAAGGFAAAGVPCGVKAGGVLDLTLLRAHGPAQAAAVFTTSTTAAPAIDAGREAIADGMLEAVVVVSGCANAGTGAAGRAAIDEVATAAAQRLGIASSNVLVSTTGPVGPLLPTDRVVGGLDQVAAGLGSSPEHGTAAAAGIVTTDSVTKEATTRADGYTIGGMAKGAGMVRPDMATMLAFLTTDAVVDAPTLQKSLREAVDVTFHCLNIDGCQSTNDTVAILASGDSGVEPDPAGFTRHLTEVCLDLVRQMAADAEGASRVVTIEVTGASDDATARHLGRAVADAALVRSSFYGGDPNWGRLLVALGVAGHPVDPLAVGVRYAGVTVAEHGVAVGHDEEALLAALETGDFTVDLTVGGGPGRATIVTTDLTPEYVRFNGERS